MGASFSSTVNGCLLHGGPLDSNAENDWLRSANVIQIKFPIESKKNLQKKQTKTDKTTPCSRVCLLEYAYYGTGSLYQLLTYPVCASGVLTKKTLSSICCKVAIKLIFNVLKVQTLYSKTGFDFNPPPKCRSLCVIRARSARSLCVM